MNSTNPAAVLLFSPLRIVVALFGVFSTYLFILLVGSSMYWLIYFHRQTTVFLFLPLNGEESLFFKMLIMAVSMKLLEVANIVYRQITPDIFFIDAEKSHGTLLGPAGTPGADAPVRFVLVVLWCISSVHASPGAFRFPPSLTLVVAF